ncbi:anaerobic ribonucleoside-triphosphate reductase [Clostridium botulinum]|uniref:anaerobic ribonucleoside-triphosphate reductase n=1 Tax=Clostridium botulinum TaxID=1491 RepID=UPI0004D9370D|nr:anaerobic ribonucleoside-triphosphate reductase [Clostridium botulinum]KEH96490.1 anaerobic ribonucleoside-triphosphate reductase [Clostridium botulinum D str. 16868]
MIKTVIKRDGREVDFNINRIVNAIELAMKDTKQGIDKELSVHIANDINKINKDKMTVEEIQDIVEDKLMDSRKDVAKEYIKYRNERNKARDSKSNVFEKMQDTFDMKSEDNRDNANKAGDKLQTYRAMIADIACREFARTKTIPEKILKEHKKTIYQHDENYVCLPFFNCILIDYRDMLKGFKVGMTPIETPKSITTAIAILSQIVAHVSSNCYGGNTLAEIDEGLEIYAKRSYKKHFRTGMKWLKNKKRAKKYAWEKLEKEVYDACQGFEYEIQTLTNSRGEVPFLTITFGKGRGKFCRLIQESYLKVRIDGLTGGITPVFPKICFILKRGLNLEPQDPQYDIYQLALKCTSKRIYPDYLMYDKIVEVTGDFKSPMSCRSFLSTYKDENGHIKTDGRFNQGVCSINLVRIAIQSKGDENKFFELLHNALDLTKEALMFRHSMLKGIKAKQAPILYMNGAVARLNPEDTIDKLLYNNYSSISIGYVGLHNCMVALYGKSYYESEEMLEKGTKIMQCLRAYCDKAKEETTIGFSLYSTPAETLATKFCKEDVKDFGIIEGVNDQGYYENSFHYPSNKDITPFEKIDLESHYSKIASGGAIQYVEFGNMENNLEALEKIVTYAYDKCHYFGVNVRPDRCLKCGYKGVINPQHETENDYICPQCGNTDPLTMNICIRLCGYIGSLSERPTIDNKMKEMHNRVVHCGVR